jgi:O-acetyl-ADP-ribose deacetylase (regulator of RNase III)
MFPDCVEATRHRGKSPHAAQDDWQLELLCNIAAAEILMPTGMEIDPHTPINSETMLRLQSQFDVSMEAVANRLASVSRKPFTIVVAARADENEKVPKYRVDYVRPSRTSQITLSEGLEITSQVFAQCTAVGYTAKGREKVSGDSPELDWECIGVPPYPGKKFPRVVGIASLRSSRPSDAPSLVSVRGNALEPRGARPWIIAQIVNDKAQIWGAGFAKAVGIKFPEAQADFIEWARNSKNLSLGNVHAYEVSSDLTIFSMIAQHGYGESELPRIRYAALRKCLEQLGNFARDHSASVHMPRIGTGYAGGNWSFIVELIDETIVRMGTRATVYTPADREPIMTKHVVALTSDRWKDAYG